MRFFAVHTWIFWVRVRLWDTIKQLLIREIWATHDELTSFSIKCDKNTTDNMELAYSNKQQSGVRGLRHFNILTGLDLLLYCLLFAGPVCFYFSAFHKKGYATQKEEHREEQI